MRFTRSPFSISAVRAIAIALLIGAVPVEAGESGGTGSPFEYGAGARALSLGGAYVAAATGPAAMVWNPAGLAGETVKQVSFFYTSPFVDDNRYTFLGYVHPFLDLGTIGVGNIRYGVGGIEKYDAGGEALGEFSNSQNEWILGYALPPFGPARFGANLKIETHSLDGYSATAVGADVGFLFKWREPAPGVWSTRNLSFGLSIRNVLEPRLTLQSDEERLPALVRSGFAYSVPLRGSLLDRLQLLLAFEQGKWSGGRTRYGAELTLPAGIDLRMGATPYEWSSGLGLDVPGGTLDYSFGSGDLGSAHRLEMTFAFGSSLNMLRAERESREEEILSRRTREEIERNEQAQIRSHVDEGKRHLKAGSYADAESWFDRALLWDPENEEAVALRSEAKVRKHISSGNRFKEDNNLLDAIAEFSAALAVDPGDETAGSMLEEATDLLNRNTARDREVSAYLTKGIEQLALSGFIEAMKAFESALQIEPENADVQRYLARTDSLIDLRVAKLVEEGRWSAGSGDIQTARSRFSEAISLRPKRGDLGAEIARLSAAAGAGEGGAAGTPATVKPRREVTDEERREVERMYRAGLEEFRQRRSREAIRYFEFVFGLLPDYENVGEYLKQAYIFTGMEKYTSGELAEAITVWEKILTIDPEDEKALTYLRRARIAMQKAKELTGGNR